jgi:drug/metabolite transporter (DMT)-like permease
MPTTVAAAGRHPSKLRLLAAFTLMVTVWSGAFIAVKVASVEAPPLLIALLRASATAAALAPFAAWEMRGRLRSSMLRGDAWRFVLSALTGVTVNQVCFIVGVSNTSVAHSSIVLSLGPMLVLLAAVIARQERATARQFTGMAVAMSGVVWLQLGGSGGGAASSFGDFIAFLSAAAFAVYSIVNKRLAERYGGGFINATGFAVGALGMLPLGLWAASGVAIAQFSARVWLAIAYMVVFQGVVGYSCFYYLLSHVRATQVSLFSYIQPVEATLMAWLLLGEPVTLTAVVAGAIVLAGVWLTMKSPGTADARLR